MPGKYKKILIKYFWKGSKKYFSVFYLSALLILVTGIVSPIMIEQRQHNWEKELNKLLSSIDNSVSSSLKARQNVVLQKSAEVKRLIRSSSQQGRLSSQEMIEALSRKNFSDYSVEVFDNHENLAAWTSEIAIPQERFFPLFFDPGEVHFFRSGLYTYLTVKDTVILPGGRTYYESVSLPVEKYYSIQNDYYEKISLTDKFTSDYLTPFEIEYSPVAHKSLDGRKYSVVINNNKNHQIAVVTFLKPARDESQANLKDFFIDLQSVLAVIGLIGLLKGFYNELNGLKSRLLKTSVLILFTVAVRFALFFLEVPAKFFEGPLTNSSYFASSFGLGIVKSPLEFFITVICALFICVNIYENVASHVKSSLRKEKNNTFLFVILTALSGLLYLVFLRGLGASIRSVIFDSSLRYFKEPGLFPNYPAALMQLNVLLLGIGSVLIAVSILLTLFYYIPARGKTNVKKSMLLLFIGFQIAGIVYDLTQHEPQGTPLIRILFVCFTFILAYKIYFEEGKVLYNYVYFALVSSVITISLLNFYNSLLEKESIKTTAIELTRASDEWLEFLVREALINATRNDETVKALKEQGTNFETAAFMIWSQSSLQREAMRSSVTLLDRDKRLLGSFGVDINPMYRVTPMVLNYEGEDMQIFNNYRPEGLDGKIISGIIPIKEDNVLLGYVAASVLFNPNNYKVSSLPPFLASNYSSSNSTVNFDKLKVFEFENDKLINVYGDITPADTYTKSILFTSPAEREAWTTLNVDDENYTTYILREIKGDNLRTIAVLLKEKTFSWSLYNFFKVFFIHSIFIIFLLLVLYGVQIRKSGFIRYTFRAQLLAAFLFISLLPLLFMAFYNRNLTEEKNRDLILLKLGQNTSNIESYVRMHLGDEKNKPLNLILSEASRDLNLDFSLFSGPRQTFTTREEYFRAGILPEVINPVAYSKLYFQGYTKYDMTEQVESYKYNAIYTRVSFQGREYVLRVSDMFTRISLPITGEEVDIFLFGSYFFATILVIIISTLLANRISSPIRGLTRATVSVAGGDLNFEIKNKQKGEIKDLVNGFNSMIKELKRSQTELAQMERESAWKEMARQVAHEIKNPLTPMKLAVQQLMIAYRDKSPKFDAIFDRVSKTIINQIDTLSNIASEFSGFARMPNLKMERVDLLNVIQEACDLYVEENVKISLINDAPDLTIEADKDQLKRTIINLIRNSIQAGATSVSLKTESMDEVISLEISDNGRGIPGEFISRIFEPNFTTKEKGMGLGLKIAKKFMEGIGGTISIAGSSEKGTRILLQFKRMR